MSSLKSESKKSVGEKLLLAGGAAALTMASGNPAEAAVVSALNTPISPPASPGDNFWDVDGDSTADFNLFKANQWASFKEVNGGRFVAATTRSFAGFAPLATGFQVGASMPGFKFFNSAQTQLTVTGNGLIGSALSANGWSLGDLGAFGFKFTSSGNTYYGWGLMSVIGGSPAFTITQAYYNNTPGATIAVGDTGGAVPEPSTCALALLAAGGVAAYKRHRKQAAV
jgi:hypothetical protein